MGGCANREAILTDVDGAPVGASRLNMDPSEMVRRLTTGAEVTRVSSRRKNVEDVIGSRPSSCAVGNSRVSSSRLSGKLMGPTRGRSTRRMSRMGSFARAEFISGVKGMAESKGHCGRTLDGRLAKFGMQMKEMEGDGNCQFRSFAYNLFGVQGHHSVTRKAAVAHMEKNKDFFSIFFETQREFKAYLNEMRRSRTWGDELTLRAIVEAYGCEVHVITSEPANWYLVYAPECHPEQLDPAVAVCPRGVPLPSPRKQVFISYISPIHYNSIVACGKE